MSPLTRLCIVAVSAASLLSSLPARAADHGDAPALAQDSGADIADVFTFLDPNDNTQLVLIATFHGFIVPGEVSNFAVYDENIRYRFEIYNDHVNVANPFLSTTSTARDKAAFLAKVKPNRTIDVTFSKREVGTDPQSTPSNGNPIPTNLRKPHAQIATVTLGGFTGVRDKGVYPGVEVTPFGVGATASALQVYEIPDVKDGSGIRVFAGEVDDPFFFDIPGFTKFVDSIREGTPSTSGLSRGRDTFAGYNVLSIALRLPVAWVKATGASNSKIGVDFLTQRHATETLTPTGVKGAGAFKTIDRMGNPAVNVALIPFDLKNAYNAATPRDDVQLKFAGAITTTLANLGLPTTSSNAAYGTLVNVAVAHGDLLQLDTTITNTGTNSAAAFPNGRRVTDDTIDTLLTLINNNTTLGDSVNANDRTLPTVFPFLATPNQPRFDNSVDDGTRN